MELRLNVDELPAKGLPGSAVEKAPTWRMEHPTDKSTEEKGYISYVDYARWATMETLKDMDRSAGCEKKNECLKCYYVAKSDRRLRVHIKQHYLWNACLCGYTHVSRDMVFIHQKSLQDDPEHRGRVGRVYSVDLQSYPNMIRYLEWTQPPPFPKLVPILRNRKEMDAKSLPNSKTTSRATVQPQEATGRSLSVQPSCPPINNGCRQSRMQRRTSVKRQKMKSSSMEPKRRKHKAAHVVRTLEAHIEPMDENPPRLTNLIQVSEPGYHMEEKEPGRERTTNVCNRMDIPSTSSPSSKLQKDDTIYIACKGPPIPQIERSDTDRLSYLLGRPVPSVHFAEERKVLIGELEEAGSKLHKEATAIRCWIVQQRLHAQDIRLLRLEASRIDDEADHLRATGSYLRGSNLTI